MTIAKPGSNFWRNLSRPRHLGMLSYAEVRGGGGDTPEWLPEGAVAYADFVNGHYYAGGAETTAGAVFESETVNAVDYIPANIVAASGYESDAAVSCGAKFTDAVLTEIGNEFTIVVEFSKAVNDKGFYFEFFDDPAWEKDYVFRVTGEVSGSGVLNYSSGGTTDVTLGQIATGAGKAAFTLSTNMVMSINGSAIIDVPASGSGFNIGYFAMSSTASQGDIILKSITVYAAKPDGDLPTLSAIA